MMKSFSVICILASVLIGGCVNLEPTPDIIKTYVLGPGSETLLTTSLELQAVHEVYVDRPEIPAYLSGKDLLVRAKSGQITKLPSSRWGEPLEEGLARSLAEYIASAQGGGGHPGYYPWSKLDRDIPMLRVRFERFSGTADGGVEFAAKWSLLKSGRTLNAGYVIIDDVTWDPGDADSYVAALNNALRRFVQELMANQP